MADKVVYHDAPKTEEHYDTAVADAVKAEPAEVETTDRGLFGLFGKKDEEKKSDEAAISSEFESKVHVTEPEPKEEEKHETLVEKFRQADSSSSSSSDEEECVDGVKRKKKKGLKEKLQDKIGERKEKKEEEKAEHDTSVPVEKCDDVAVAPPLGQVTDPPPTQTPEPEEKKGFMEKIKDKLPGGHKKPEEEHVAPPPPPSVAAHDSTAAVEDEPKEKKGIFEKIKEKIPGYHGKTTEEEKKEKECD